MMNVSNLRRAVARPALRTAALIACAGLLAACEVTVPPTTVTPAPAPIAQPAPPPVTTPRPIQANCVARGGFRDLTVEGCFQCPAGTQRTVFAVTSNKACQQTGRVIDGFRSARRI